MLVWIIAAVAVIAVAVAVIVAFGGKVQCRNCGFYVSAKEEICPNCGCNLREAASGMEPEEEDE